MQIGGHDVGGDNPTYVIAEAGSNHDGELEQAKQLVDVAADAGADAVKFQTFRAETMYVEDAGTVGGGGEGSGETGNEENGNGERAGSESEEGTDEQSLYDLVAEMEMPYDWIPELRDHCERRGLDFLSTPLDERAVDELDQHVPAFKVASSTLSHHPFLRYVASKGKPIVASTGAHDLDDVREALGVLRDAGAEEVALLHCVSSYPTPLDEANVRAVATLADEFDVPVGFSDHTLDPTVAPCAAVALGAAVVEKHFTLDRSLSGADHGFALEPDELDRMISAIRDTEAALGTGEIAVQDAERDWYESARRTVHATRDLDAGHRITDEDVAVLRSGEREKGLEPKHYDEIVGATTAREISADDGITWEDVE